MRRSELLVMVATDIYAARVASGQGCRVELAMDEAEALIAEAEKRAPDVYAELTNFNVRFDQGTPTEGTTVARTGEGG